MKNCPRCRNVKYSSNVGWFTLDEMITDNLQPLDSAFIACLKNVYKRWLNLEIFNSEQMPSKFDKIKRISEIFHSMLPEIGKYCWDATVYKENEEAEKLEKNDQFKSRNLGRKNAECNRGI